jgi:hypothetical protein
MEFNKANNSGDTTPDSKDTMFIATTITPVITVRLDIILINFLTIDTIITFLKELGNRLCHTLILTYKKDPRY